MFFFRAVGRSLSNYFTISGRASRTEYFSFWLFTMLATFVVMYLDGTFEVARRAATSPFPRSEIEMLGMPTIYTALFFAIPSITVAVRRLHDADFNGWWYFIGIVPIIGPIIAFILPFMPGTIGRNRFGPNPRFKKQKHATVSPEVASQISARNDQDFRALRKARSNE